MPDLGRYALEVGLAYGVGLVILAVIVLQSWRRDLAARRALRQAERGRDGAD
jgi:heme exporter protein CcmD